MFDCRPLGTWPYTRYEEDVHAFDLLGGIAQQSAGPGRCSTGLSGDVTEEYYQVTTSCDELRSECEVTLSKPKRESATIEEVDPGIFVIRTRGEDYSLP